MEELKIKYKIKRRNDPGLDRDLRKLLKKHGFKYIGSGFDLCNNWRDMQFERNENEKTI